MFDRIRPPEADSAAGTVTVTVKGYALPAAPQSAERSTCTQCGARVHELRRGRCWGCYQAWVGVRPVGQGARCLVCSERRRDCLRLAEIHGRWLPMCHLCATRAARLSPVPYTIEALRRALSRERRHDDRRIDALDGRSLPRDRRQADRRHSRPDDAAAEFWVDLDMEDRQEDATGAIDLHPVEDKTDPRIVLPVAEEALTPTPELPIAALEVAVAETTARV